MTENSQDKPKPRKLGRPKKTDGPAFDRAELDRLLVHGEVQTDEEGGTGNVHYPTHTELAKRFGISRSLVSKYAKRHDTLTRRMRAVADVDDHADAQVTEARAKLVGLRREEEIAIIDRYLRGFEKALIEGRVRYDNVADYNTMIRLKAFLLGDSEAEAQAATITLVDIQERYEAAKRREAATSAAMRGLEKQFALGEGGNDST